MNSSEGPALGVALLAGVGAGIYKSVPEACDQTIRVVTHQDYNKDNHVAYQKFYSLYNDIYQSLKNDFKTLAKVNQS